MTINYNSYFKYSHVIRIWHVASFAKVKKKTFAEINIFLPLFVKTFYVHPLPSPFFRLRNFWDNSKSFIKSTLATMEMILNYWWNFGRSSVCILLRGKKTFYSKQREFNMEKWVFTRNRSIYEKNYVHLSVVQNCLFQFFRKFCLTDLVP